MSQNALMNVIFPQNLFDNKKVLLMATLGVLALHGFVGVGLAYMAMPKIVPVKVTTPLEISFIKVTPPSPEVVKPMIKPALKPNTNPKLDPKPVIESEPIASTIINQNHKTVATTVSQTSKTIQLPLVKHPNLLQLSIIKRPSLLHLALVKPLRLFQLPLVKHLKLLQLRLLKH